MKILITGSNGFIAQHIINYLLEQPHFEILATSCNADRLPFGNASANYRFSLLDIAHQDRVNDTIQSFMPHLVIHTAAMGSADLCEIQKENCNNINVQGTENVANACKQINARLIFLSTDFVFSGQNGPYKESDDTDPVNNYGLSKIKAELFIRSNMENLCIIRLCSVYGPAFSGKARGIITLTREKLTNHQIIRVVDDQYRTPTYVTDIADAVLRIIHKGLRGIIHISGQEMTTPFEMATTAADFFGLDRSLVQRVSTLELNEPAKRPMKTGFIIDKAIKELNFNPTSFAQGLALMHKENY